MSEAQEEGGSTDERLDQILEELGALRREMESVRQYANEAQKRDGIERAIAEYRRLPSDAADSLRWGFLAAWGRGGSKGAQNSAHSIHTTNIEEFLESTSSDDVAAFARVFADPNTVAVCKCIFRYNGATRDQLREDCSLGDAEVDAAIAPLLEWNFVEWREDCLKTMGQGINFCMTILSMAAQGMRQKQEQ